MGGRLLDAVGGADLSRKCDGALSMRPGCRERGRQPWQRSTEPLFPRQLGTP